MCISQGPPHLTKIGQHDFSLGCLDGEVRENLGVFRKTSKISFPATVCPPTFHKTNMLLNDLKKDAINKFRIKISNPVWLKCQKHGHSFYMT